MKPPYNVFEIRKNFNQLFNNYNYVDFKVRYGRNLFDQWRKIYYSNKNNKYNLLKFLRMRAEMEELKYILPVWDEQSEKCQSPQELFMYDSFKRHEIDVKYGLYLITQYPVLGSKTYFADFAFVDGTDLPPPLLIEYDSKDFHPDFEADLRRAEDIDEYMIMKSFCGSDFEAYSIEVDLILNKYYLGRLRAIENGGYMNL